MCIVAHLAGHPACPAPPSLPGLPVHCPSLPYKPRPYAPTQPHPAARRSAAYCPCRQRQRIRYMHANMEATGLPDASVDMITVQFVVHECPAQVIENLVRLAGEAGESSAGQGQRWPPANLLHAGDTHFCPGRHVTACAAAFPPLPSPPASGAGVPAAAAPRGHAGHCGQQPQEQGHPEPAARAVHADEEVRGRRVDAHGRQAGNEHMN